MTSPEKVPGLETNMLSAGLPLVFSSESFLWSPIFVDGHLDAEEISAPFSVPPPLRTPNGAWTQFFFMTLPPFGSAEIFFLPAATLSEVFSFLTSLVFLAGHQASSLLIIFSPFRRMVKSPYL